MNIALIAHDSKKELMVQFCIAYSGVLARHNLCATGVTGKMISDATGLPVVRFLSGSQGGSQQIAARISCNEIDVVLYFRDPLDVSEPSTSDISTIIRLCDMHNIRLPPTLPPARCSSTGWSGAIWTGATSSTRNKKRAASYPVSGCEREEYRAVPAWKERAAAAESGPGAGAREDIPGAGTEGRRYPAA